MAKITIYLKRGDVDAATRAFQMAKVAHSRGIRLACSCPMMACIGRTRTGVDQKTGTNDTASEFFSYLVENEVPIYV